MRHVLRSFAPKRAPSNTLVWDDALDAEDGSGVRMALLDSGVNWSHGVFSGARLLVRDFTGGGDVFDRTDHGTANAALLVGKASEGDMAICPGAELMIAKVLAHRDWEITVRSVRAALRWAVRASCDVIALPFGTARGALGIAHEIRMAAARGCQVFAAAGNRGPDSICFPAWLPEVIAVSALTVDGNIHPRCCTGSGVDIYAWGDRIPVFGLGVHTELSGSSPATVLAAGFAALKVAKLRRKSY